MIIGLIIYIVFFVSAIIHISKRQEFLKHKKAFEKANSDEQLLDIVYNTFELKEKK